MLNTSAVPPSRVSTATGERVGNYRWAICAPLFFMFVAQAPGHVLQYTGSYVPLFSAAAGAYLLAFFIMHMILPRRRRDILASEVPAQ